MTDVESFPSLEALLHRLGLIGESAQVECKESLWRLPRDVWETVSAFSNTAGGTLLLVYARKTGRLDNAAYRSLNHTDTLTASRALTHLEGLGLLERSEQRRGPGVYYTLAEEVGGTPQVTPQVTPQGMAELPRLLTEGKRLSRSEMADLLVALCAERPRTARELAQLLHRNMKYLRDTYLSPMVREGRLELTGPPNDPNVAYRAAGQPEAKREGNQP